MPQHQRVVFVSTAQVCWPPAATAFQAPVPIWTGLVRLVVVPSPTWANWL